MRICDALGDPTRRAIFEKLWRRPMPVGELARGLPVTRSAVSQHLKIMLDLGLVKARTVGVRRIYSVEPSGLWPLRSWIEGHMPRAVGVPERGSYANVEALLPQDERRVA